ncbi:MAG: bile acid:sodium symporter [Desulfovibrionaceae bacterium]|nr:bile acid:sodium symporter [Desulfovibrionaceae bacterium]
MDFMKLEPVLILCSAAAGLAVGQAVPDVPYLVCVEPLLTGMLFFVFLSLEAGRLKDSFRNLRFTLASTGVNFVWTPLLAFALGLVFLPGRTDLQIGLMMLCIAPCTDWYLIFTGLARGNVELGASILPLNLVLQIALLPLYLFIFFGGSVQTSPADLAASIVAVLVAPAALAVLLRAGAGRSAGLARVREGLGAVSEPAQLLFLCLAIAAMFAAESGSVLGSPAVFARLLAPVLLFFAVNLFAVRLLVRRLGMSWEDGIALNLTTLARNSPLSLAIAASAFPGRADIAFVLVVGALIELPVLALIAWYLRGKRG